MASLRVANVNLNRVTVPRQGRKMTVRASVAANASGVDVLKMAPIGDRLLVKPKELEKQSSGGVLLASGSAPSMQDAIVGTVVSVGDEVDISVAVGDRVLFTKYGTSDVEAADGTLSFVAQKSILAVLS